MLSCIGGGSWVVACELESQFGPTAWVVANCCLPSCFYVLYWAGTDFRVRMMMSNHSC